MDQILLLLKEQGAFPTLPAGVAENADMGLKNHLVTKLNTPVILPFSALPSPASSPPEATNKPKGEKQ